MKSTLIFAAAASAAVIKRQAASDCCFGINISGAQAGFTGSAGSLGELYDGQIRVGPGYSNSTFCYNQASQSIVDQSGRGCVEIGAPKQYQCDEGKTASGGITIDAAGVISHNGSSIWYECLVNDQGVYNIYTADTGLATKCQQIKLTTTNGSCGPKVSTVTAPGTTVVGPTVTMPGQATTVTAPGQATTVTAPAQVSTVTAPAPAAQVSTMTIPGAGSVTTVTAQATCPAPVAASTVTVTGPAPAAQTVTVSAPAPAAQTVTVTAPAPAAQTVTVTSVQSCATQTQTKVQATTATQVQATTVVVPTTVVSVSMAVSTQTQVVPTTLTQSGTTVVVSQTTKQTVSVSTTITQSTTAVVTPPAPTTASTTVVKPTTSSAVPTPSNVCPLTLADKVYTYPHLIVPVNSAQPSKAYGTQYFASVNSMNSTIFNFDVEGSWAGKTCDVVFTIPEKALLETTDYTLKSGGSFAVSQLNTVATQQTTYSNMGAGKALGNFPVVVGTKNVIASGPCAAGTAQSFEFTAASGLDLTWFNDWNPCPLGVFMVAH